MNPQPDKLDWIIRKLITQCLVFDNPKGFPNEAEEKAKSDITKLINESRLKGERDMATRLANGLRKLDPNILSEEKIKGIFKDRLAELQPQEEV